MDTRVIVNLPQVPDLAQLPELAGADRIQPALRPGDPVDKEAPLSLVIPTFFNTELKRRSLRHLLRHVTDSRCVAEVVFVETDGEKHGFEDLAPLLHGLPVQVVASPPHNRAASRNAGANAARHDHLLFLDDDMVPHHWRTIDVILSHLLVEGFDCALFPRRQYVRFPLLFDDWHLDRTVQHWREGGLEEDPFLWDPIRHGSRDLPMVFCFPGCFTLIKRDAYQRLGGFDEQFVGWGFEDTDFALRAVRDLRVLNLFRKSHPFLHIDHPVSPYKSEEHENNSRKYFASPTSIDLHQFCRSVYQGRDYIEPGQSLAARDVHLLPFRQLQARGVPVSPETMHDWAGSVAQRLLSRFSHPVPDFILLHGSRASERHRPDSDYDVLMLYRGLVQDFFGTRQDPRVEIECASRRVFQQLAEEPWLYDSRGVLDLAKIAQARLLVGDEKAWLEWKTDLLRSAVSNGRAFWLVLAVGLHLSRDKIGPLWDRYQIGLSQLLNVTDNDGDTALLASLKSLTDLAVEALSRDRPDWREQMKRHAPVFPLQIPEVWSALHHLQATWDGTPHFRRRARTRA